MLRYFPSLSSLYINTKSENFGADTFFQHGSSTVITAEKLGLNCWINQQVIIGYNDSKKYGYGKVIPSPMFLVHKHGERTYQQFNC